MGWQYYNGFSDPISKLLARFNTSSNQIKNRVLYYFFSGDKKLCFAIKEICDDSKLQNNNRYNEYEFIIVEVSEKSKNYTKISCKSNIELLYLVREHLACDLSYQRQFQINSILK